ncbi:MAG: efflux RND transporter periplasmic adaptor subunit [Bacteroides sp.]|nr:efflux RND transporter periplasmic adaptor subunit [Bacteroides sp.]
MKKYIIGTFLIPALMISCSRKDKNSEVKKEIFVKVVDVKTSEIGYQQNYVGTVEETFSSLLSFEVTGNVSDIYVREGQKVYKGQLIACLNKATFQNSHDIALSTLKQAEDAYNRMKTLYENNSLPEIKWIEIQTSLQQAKSMESIARKSLNDCSLHAPFSGVISDRNIEAGTNVMPGMPAFKLVTVNKVKIKIAVPEKEISHTHIGQTADIKIAALENRQVSGRVSEKNVAANPLSHTYEVKIALDNPDGDLMPGMVCHVNINPEQSEEDMIVVPANAIQVNHTGEGFVWLVENNRARKRIVKTGRLSDDGVIITGGLTIGEQVIVEGNQKVSEGIKVAVR